MGTRLGSEDRPGVENRCDSQWHSGDNRATGEEEGARRRATGEGAGTRRTGPVGRYREQEGVLGAKSSQSWG